jgi:competence protein ComEA
LVDLLRPEPPRSWRARLAPAAAGLSAARLATAAGAVLLLAVTAWWLLRSPAPPVERSLPTARSLGAATTTPAPARAPTLAAPPTSIAALVVQAAGAVTTPGVYRVPSGSRVLDVVTAAGGPTSSADLGAIALAAKVADGQRIYVPQKGEPPPATTPDGGGPGPPPVPVDLNAADLNALEGLPGVGPALGRAILDYRDRNGPFRSVDDLLDVRGIGPAKLDGFRDLVTVGG